MIDVEELLAVAYKKERERSRRLSKGASLSEHEALIRTMAKVAGSQSLADLIATRRATQQKYADAVRTREAERASRANRKPVVTDAPAWRGWFDGSALPNPGRVGIGAVLQSPQGEVVEISAEAGRGDSSVAEYRALIALLEAALREGATEIAIHGDSRVVIDDMHASEGAGIRSLTHFAREARALIARIGAVRLTWIPRERNASADVLSRRALDGASIQMDTHDAQPSSRTSAMAALPNASLNK
ncbi:ribonuclease HI family protein [Caballeronia sp. GAFFF2]|uniref:ribonuclease HI family protein n=1 Tax=Caballeronia sp. GAFFF2 TaxID=2921741 RepID=UPI002028D1C7|nr:ribonuclease HI family protein [Caballeronia sp. GAFFF2]